MGDQIIGILHPGAMGVSIAAAAKAAGNTCLWLPEGRGEATRARAEKHGLAPAASFADIIACPVILSVCPPHAALDVATAVASAGFSGIYMDGNAVSPMTTREVDALLQEPLQGETPEAVRDAAMLELMYATGMRVTELVSLNVDSLHLSPQPGYVRCIGKGEKERTIPVYD